MRKICQRCGQKIYLPHTNSDICCSCEADLMSEMEANAAMAHDRAREEEAERWRWEQEQMAEHDRIWGEYHG